MSKLFWVLMPLMLVAAGFALQAWRRRPPSRRTVNMVASLLLLGYVATTAGLGIFWVANQQLPVFDWHYLFGYATVLLVGLHLVFNFGAAWRHLWRSRSTGEAQRPVSGEVAAVEIRRGGLRIAGAALLAGLTFVLGLRHGRSDLRVDAAPASSPDTVGADSASLVERYHAHSSHSRRGVLLRAPGVDWGDPPPAFKRYPQAERVALPRPGARGPSGAGVDLQTLAMLLWHTAGVTDVRGPLALRASPSSGALFSTELYVAAHAVAGLAPGLWHYEPGSEVLERLPGRWPDVARGAGAEIVATAVFRRSGHKYRDRTYRYVLADLGHAIENLSVAAQALGLAIRIAARFDEAQAAAALALDQAEEGVLARIAIGAAPDLSTDAPPEPAFAWQAQRWPEPGGALGLTGAMHAATSLRAVSARPAERGPTSGEAPPAAGGPAFALPRVPSLPADRLALIAKRRSVRRHAARPLPLHALAGVLAGLDGEAAPRLSAALRLYLVVHDVAGLAPGAYRVERGALAFQRRDADPRRVSRAAALEQDVIGEAAAVVVLVAERAAIMADPAGPARGYRHAFIEAGRIGERVYLEAAARGLACCAVGAFYDDEAAALLGVDPARTWVLHFAALGLPASAD